MSTPNELLSCTLHRELNGLKIELASKKIEAAMRLVSGGRTRTSSENGLVWEGHTYYSLPMGTNGIPTAFAGFTAGRFDLWGAKELLFNREPTINLSMLLAVGLGDGVKIIVPTVISERTLIRFTEGFKSAVRQFYIDFLKESEITIRITTEEIRS
jgi:hypothetical protein